MKTKFIFLFIIVAVAFVWFKFYPLRFDFYEESKSKSLADLIVLPVFAIVAVYYLARKFSGKDINKTLLFKELLFSAALFIAAYFLILRSLFSSILLVVNAAYTEKNTIWIDAKVTEIVKIEGHGKMIGKYEMTLNQNGKIYIFESNKKAIDHFSTNENVRLQFKKGLLNLLYR